MDAHLAHSEDEREGGTEVNGLLAAEMFRLGGLAAEYRSHAPRIAVRLEDVATQLAEARHDEGQTAALEALRDLAEDLTRQYGDARLEHLYARLTLAFVPA